MFCPRLDDRNFQNPSQLLYRAKDLKPLQPFGVQAQDIYGRVQVLNSKWAKADKFADAVLGLSTPVTATDLIAF